MNSKNTASKKNIVIVLLESFSSSYIGCLNNGKGYSPGFDSLKNDGMLFTNFYSNGPRTQHVIVSTLSSFPAILSSPLIRRKGINEFQTLGTILKKEGYKNNFIYGGDIGFDDMDIYLHNSGFDDIISENDFSTYRYKNEWGVCDEDLFDKAIQILNNNDTILKFTVILTVSNHAPFDIPEYFNDKISRTDSLTKKQSTFLYLDYCLKKFMKECKTKNFYNKTVFYILADHGEAYSVSDHNYKIFKIPLLIMNSNLGIGSNNILGSQIDIAPTILNEIGYQNNYHFIGKSMYNLQNRYALCQAINKKILFIDQYEYALVFDPKIKESKLYKISDNKLVSNGNQVIENELDVELKSILQSLSSIYVEGKYRFE